MIRYKPNPITTFARWLWTWLPELIALLMVIIIAAGLVWIFNMLLSTRDKLLIDLQAALNRRDWKEYNEIIDALIDMDERDGRKSEWEKQGQGKVTEQQN
jgi:hypothetical protein